MTWLETFLTLDLPALGAGALSAAACGVVGCFLVLRRMSLMGDAIGHAVLPGLVGAFLLAGSANAGAMFVGAVVVGVLTTGLTEAVHRLGKVEQGASMGVVFTVLFALGVLMLERLAGSNVHIDADCVLYGQMEGVVWLDAPARLAGLFEAGSWAHFPRQVTTLAVVCALTFGFITLLYKELKITTFDPGLATTMGIHAGLVRYVLMTMVAVVAVSSFEAVGSILVVATLVIPGMVAHLLTDRLWLMLVLAGVIGFASAVMGYVCGAFGPGWFGLGGSVSAAGMTGVVLGVLLVGAAVMAPGRGVLSLWLRRRALRARIELEDVLGAAFRAMEGGARGVGVATLSGVVGSASRGARAAEAGVRRGLLRREGEGWSLTEEGREEAARLVRVHRLWETYLVREGAAEAGAVHDSAERLEHVTGGAIERELGRKVGAERTDPHGRPIPRE